jgi:hypothetical protein
MRAKREKLFVLINVLNNGKQVMGLRLENLFLHMPLRDWGGQKGFQYHFSNVKE